jgi:hypothetical protein
MRRLFTTTLLGVVERAEEDFPYLDFFCSGRLVRLGWAIWCTLEEHGCVGLGHPFRWRRHGGLRRAKTRCDTYMDFVYLACEIGARRYIMDSRFEKMRWAERLL